MDERPSEEIRKQETGSESFLTKLYRPGPLIAIFTLIFISLVSLGYYVLTEDTPPPEILPAVKQAAPEPARPYEEDMASEMEDKVKQADLAIIETMRDSSLTMHGLDLVDVEIRRLNGHGYHYQVLQIPSVPDRRRYLTILRKRLHSRVPEAVLLDNGDNEAAIRINDLPTHRLLLESIPMKLPKPQPKGPKLAIVIDDIGEDFATFKGLVTLDIPLTFAVWPHATHTRDSVDMIVQRRRDLIIHFPMEPQGYPKVKPGNDALFVSMTPDQIRTQIAANLKQIPEAIGVNNHMGSRFTADKPAMKATLKEFKRKGLFFLDSLTSGKSVGRSMAKYVEIPFYERDIFLDNVKDVNSIVHQLKKTERVAQSKGRAIAIGHPYKETLAALRRWGKNRNNSVVIVPLSSLTAE